MGRRMVSVLAEALLMLPPAIWPLPASVGEERIIEFPLRVNVLAPLLNEIIVERACPAEKLLVVAVCVLPVKTSRSFVAGVDAVPVSRRQPVAVRRRAAIPRCQVGRHVGLDFLQSGTHNLPSATHSNIRIRRV